MARGPSPAGGLAPRRQRDDAPELIPLLLERPADAGALATIDTIARNPAISSRPPTSEQAGKAAPTALVR